MVKAGRKCAPIFPPRPRTPPPPDSESDDTHESGWGEDQPSPRSVESNLDVSLTDNDDVDAADSDDDVDNADDEVSSSDVEDSGILVWQVWLREYFRTSPDVASAQFGDDEERRIVIDQFQEQFIMFQHARMAYLHRNLIDSDDSGSDGSGSDDGE